MKIYHEAKPLMNRCNVNVACDLTGTGDRHLRMMPLCVPKLTYACSMVDILNVRVKACLIHTVSVDFIVFRLLLPINFRYILKFDK